tara:strand:+ start:1986 stop:2516 length:531 start_codon:yes stop_codon:yes gene_type:complete
LYKDQKSTLERGDYKGKKNFIFSQDHILELAVKVVVNPSYGWLTAVLILYGCDPEETFSLIRSSDGSASVIDLKNHKSKNIRRKVLASPTDFVEKLNIFDQVSQPLFYENYDDYDFDELNDFMFMWNAWFKGIENDLELIDLKEYWAKRIINKGLSVKLAAKYMGISDEEFCLKYK